MHVVLLELIIDPTCSIVLERQPSEQDIMERRPREPGGKILTAGTFARCIIQGLAIFAASFAAYYIMLRQNPGDAALARTMGLTVIIIANLFLVQVNSSNRDFAIQSFFRLARDTVMLAVNIGIIAGLLILISSFRKLNKNS